MTIKQQLALEIEKASPEVLAQLFEFLQFLKKIVQNQQKQSKKPIFWTT